MLRNLTQGFADKLNKLFEYQNKYFGPEFINDAMIPQSLWQLQLMEVGEDRMPLDFHLILIQVTSLLKIYWKCFRKEGLFLNLSLCVDDDPRMTITSIWLVVAVKFGK